MGACKRIRNRFNRRHFSHFSPARKPTSSPTAPPPAHRRPRHVRPAAPGRHRRLRPGLFEVRVFASKKAKGFFSSSLLRALAHARRRHQCAAWTHREIRAASLRMATWRAAPGRPILLGGGGEEEEANRTFSLCVWPTPLLFCQPPTFPAVRAPPLALRPLFRPARPMRWVRTPRLHTIEPRANGRARRARRPEA